MRNLADIVNSHLSDVQKILNNFPRPLTKTKQDNSPVTELDLALSHFFEEVFRREYPGICFYSEENFSDWFFPLLALDPLDGTREFIAGRPEWAISVGHFLSEKFEGEGWVHNPVTGENFTEPTVSAPKSGKVLRGEVSRTEFDQGLYDDVSAANLEISPLGSIAYKLGRLSHGKCDFVVSRRPKNIWDIAGGSLLCQSAGIGFFSRGELVTKVQKLYEPPLLWCSPSSAPELLKIFSS